MNGLLIGTVDLSQSLGVPGQVTHPAVVEAIEHVNAAGKANGFAVGIHLGDIASLRHWISAGMCWMMLSSEVGLLADAAAVQIRQIRSDDA